MVDGNGNTVAVSVFHLAAKAYKDVVQKKVVTLIDPVVRRVRCGDSEYRCISLSDPRNFLVNGRALAGSFQYTGFSSTNFDA